MNFGSVVDILTLAISSKAMLGGRGSKSVSTVCRHLRELLTSSCSEKGESDVNGDADLARKGS